MTKLRYQIEEMIEEQLKGRGINNQKVLSALERVPREKFVPRSEREYAYRDRPLPIGFGQTISQPYMVAKMTEVLEPEETDTVLEIGTGSGYQTAILAEIFRAVFTVEVVTELSSKARSLLEDDMGYRNIKFRVGDGKSGWEANAPFDKIVVTAAPKKHPFGILGQLREGGVACAPVGNLYQSLFRYKKINNKIESEELFGVSFVRLV